MPGAALHKAAVATSLASFYPPTILGDDSRDVAKYKQCDVGHPAYIKGIPTSKGKPLRPRTKTRD
jgi:hypothetical protein